MSHSQAKPTMSFQNSTPSAHKPKQLQGKDGERNTDLQRLGDEGSDGELLAAAEW